VNVRSHAGVTYGDFDLLGPDFGPGARPEDKVFKRDCLELDFRIGGRPFTLYVVHFKSMGPSRDGLDGRTATMPVRTAEARAVRRIIEGRFGAAQTAGKSFAICGDMNDYQEKLVIEGDRREGYRFIPTQEAESALDVFSKD